jgi:glycosyltransferase involved in cell wall biosynthesis
MAAVDAVCLASRFEGMPNVLLEAMASAKPVVASAVDGVQEIVEDGETGFLTPPGDDFALADALVRLAGDRSLRVQMGTAGRQRMMARHSPALNLQRHMSLYEQVLQRPRVRSSR